jgi:hypothetical protein
MQDKAIEVDDENHECDCKANRKDKNRKRNSSQSTGVRIRVKCQCELPADRGRNNEGDSREYPDRRHLGVRMIVLCDPIGRWGSTVALKV